MSALGLESHHVFELLPTNEELKQFINVDSSEDNNLNFYNICKGLSDSDSEQFKFAKESPNSVDNSSLFSSFESDCYVAGCSMTNETVSGDNESDNIHQTESSELNIFMQFRNADEKEFKQI